MEHNITIVGLDAHKNSIEIVTAETAGNQEVRHYGKIWWRHDITGQSDQETQKRQKQGGGIALCI